MVSPAVETLAFAYFQVVRPLLFTATGQKEYNLAVCACLFSSEDTGSQGKKKKQRTHRIQNLAKTNYFTPLASHPRLDKDSLSWRKTMRRKECINFSSCLIKNYLSSASWKEPLNCWWEGKERKPEKNLLERTVRKHTYKGANR